MKKLLLILLIPSLSLAQGFQVKKPKKFDQPPGTIERVSKRSEYVKVFEYDSIGSGRFVAVAGAGPLHYKDSTGVLREYNYDTKDTTGVYDKVVRIGRFELAYSTTVPGRMKYTRKKAFIEFVPAFDTTEVEIMLKIMPNGVKSEYTVIDNSRNRLAWGYDASASFEALIGAKGKGKLKDNQKIKRGDLLDFTAVDAEGNPVELTASYVGDSLIVLLDTAGAVYPITVDPTVQDTSIAAASGTFWSGNNASWAVSRAVTTGSDFDYVRNSFGGVYSVSRVFWSFPLTDLSSATRVDSTRFYFHADTKTSDPVDGWLCEGTFSGSTIAADWMNDFTGWTADSAAFSLNLFVDDSIYFATGDSVYDRYFNATGITAVDDKMGLDTLRVVMMMTNDYKTSPPPPDILNRLETRTYMPYLIIYYTVIYPPGLTTAPSDTLYGLAVMTATIDSIGSDSCTIVGFRYNLAGDTTIVADTGKFGVGEFSQSTGQILIGSTYYYQGFGENGMGTSYSPVDSFVVDTTGAGGGTIYVDGRPVNEAR